MTEDQHPTLPIAALITDVARNSASAEPKDDW
jgi:hypothetical protein